MMSQAAPLLLFALLGVPAAEPLSGSTEIAPSTEPRRLHQLRADGGFASALGLAGISYTLSPTQLLGIEAGAGYGFSGFQISLMPRLTLGHRHRFVMGAGLSLSTGSRILDGLVTWANLDAAGYEYESDDGFVFTIRAGLTHPLTKRHLSGDIGPGDLQDLIIPQARLGIGYAF